MSFQKRVQEHLRLTLLRLLEEESDRTLNDSLINDLTEDYGFTPNRDRTRTELAWLEEQGLVRLETISGLALATLTERGSDVARGRAIVPGIKRPSARA